MSNELHRVALTLGGHYDLSTVAINRLRSAGTGSEADEVFAADASQVERRHRAEVWFACDDIPFC